MIGPFDLVIFDNDGVLVDSEPLANQVLSTMLKGYGLDVDPEECVERYLGCTIDRVQELVEAELGRPLAADFGDTYRGTVYPLLEASVQPVVGVAAVVDEIRAGGTEVCVASSGKHERVVLTLRTAGLLDRFTGRMFSAEDVGRGKPFPDLFLHAAQTMGVAPERCAVVEDAAAGVAAANTAGMTAFGYDATTPARLLAAATGGRFSAMAELPALLAGATTRAGAPGPTS